MTADLGTRRFLADGLEFDADVLPDDGAVRALCAPLERRSWMSFGACDPVCKRSTAVARGAAFAARLVQDLQQRARAPEFTVGRLYGLRREAAARLAIPLDITNEDHWISLRVRELGGAVEFAPDARCRFVVPSTFDDYRRQSSRIRAGERQLERVANLQPLRPGDFLPSIAVCALQEPVGAGCWAVIYAASLAFAAREHPSDEPQVASSKGGF